MVHRFKVLASTELAVFFGFAFLFAIARTATFPEPGRTTLDFRISARGLCAAVNGIADRPSCLDLGISKYSISRVLRTVLVWRRRIDLFFMDRLDFPRI